MEAELESGLGGGAGVVGQAFRSQGGATVPADGATVQRGLLTA